MIAFILAVYAVLFVPAAMALGLLAAAGLLVALMAEAADEGRISLLQGQAR